MLETMDFEFKEGSPKTPSKRIPRKPTKSSSSKRRTEYTSPERAQPIEIPQGHSLPLSPSYKGSVPLPYMEQCFENITCIGEGSYGIVFRAQSRDDGQFYAIKKFRDKFKNSTHRDTRLEEVKRYGSIPQSQYCVEFIRAWEESAFLFVQMELCNINLDQYITENKPISEEKLWNILLDILLGVKHLHSNNFIHLDIKPENVLVAPDHLCKLGDFGLMLDLSKGEVTDADEGDSRYLAPEVLQGVFTKAADIFSIGISMLEIACNIKLPSCGTLWQDLRHGNLPQQHFPFSGDLFEVLKLMMSTNPSDRPSVEQLLAFKKFSKLYRKRRFNGLCYNVAARVKSLFRFGKMMAMYSLSFIRPFRAQVENVPTGSDSVVNTRERTPSPSRSVLVSLCTPVGPQYDDSDSEDTPKSRRKCCTKKRIVFEYEESDTSDTEPTDMSPGPSKKRRLFT